MANNVSYVLPVLYVYHISMTLDETDTEASSACVRGHKGHGEKWPTM